MVQFILHTINSLIPTQIFFSSLIPWLALGTEKGDEPGYGVVSYPDLFQKNQYFGKGLGMRLGMELFFWLVSKEQSDIESRLVVCVLAVYNYNVLDRQHLYNSV